MNRSIKKWHFDRFSDKTGNLKIYKMFGQTYSEIFSHENRNEESEPLLRDLRVGSGEESRKI